MDAAEINYKEKFDSAIIVLGFSVISDWKRALKNIIKSVKSDGKIVILDSETIGNSLVNRLIFKFVNAKERSIILEIQKLIKKNVRIKFYNSKNYFIFSGKK